jgi:hypothetical protein
MKDATPSKSTSDDAVDPQIPDVSASSKLSSNRRNNRIREITYLVAVILPRVTTRNWGTMHGDILSQDPAFMSVKKLRPAFLGKGESAARVCKPEIRSEKNPAVDVEISKSPTLDLYQKKNGRCVCEWAATGCSLAGSHRGGAIPPVESVPSFVPTLRLDTLVHAGHIASEPRVSTGPYMLGHPWLCRADPSTNPRVRGSNSRARRGFTHYAGLHKLVG